MLFVTEHPNINDNLYTHENSFENFQLEPAELSLFIGDNGTGKSSVFYVLKKIQNLINGTGKVSAL